MKRADWPKPPAGYRWLDPRETVRPHDRFFCMSLHSEFDDWLTGDPEKPLSADVDVVAKDPCVFEAPLRFYHVARPRATGKRKPSPALRIRRLRAALRAIAKVSGSDFATHTAHKALDRDDGRKVS